MGPIRNRVGWLAWGAVWLAVVTAGFFVLWQFAATRGTESQAPTDWPGATHLSRASDRATLIMFVHPGCACSRASLRELGRLVNRVRGRLNPMVVVVRPKGAVLGNDDAEMQSLAKNVSDVTVILDEGGEEARRFGASTSGACLLYDKAGLLKFQGGITQVRGHEGDSFGQERIVSLVTSGTADRNDSPIFGCSLDEEVATQNP